MNPTKEIRNLHANGSASLAELGEFLASLKARKPQEVIGIVSASLLVQSMVIATLATVAVLALFTVGPYMLYGPPKAKPSTAKQAGAKPASAGATATAEPTDAKGPTTPASATAGPDAAKATKAMGLDETKSSDPKKNPLDSPNLDKLLDGIDK